VNTYNSIVELDISHYPWGYWPESNVLHDRSINGHQPVNLADIEWEQSFPKQETKVWVREMQIDSCLRPSTIRPKSAINLLLSGQFASGATLTVIQSHIGSKLFEDERKLRFKFRRDSRSNYLRETRSTLDEFCEFALVSESQGESIILRISVAWKSFPWLWIWSDCV
jgi:hypothetical protein